jgi:transcription elongation factor SPT4
MRQDKDRINDATTSHFSGMISVLDTEGSWAARWSRLAKFVPGCYGITLYEQPPEEILQILEDNNIPLPRPS